MANVTFGYNPVPAPACYPPDLNGLAQELTTGGVLSGTIPDNAGGGVFVGSSAPPSALTNKVWFKTDSAGRPLGIYMYYNGNWRLVYTGRLGDIKIWGGNPALYFDSTGRGLPAGDQDGWALCNGKNGTPDLRDRFIVCANYWDDAFGWLTQQTKSTGVTYTSSGGSATTPIQGKNLPPMDVFLGYGPYAGSGSSPEVLIRSGNQPNQSFPVLDPTGTFVTASVPLDTLPPYIALAYVTFVGYL